MPIVVIPGIEGFSSQFIPKGLHVRDIRIAAAQFEHRNADKEYNLSRIRSLALVAAEQGAEAVSFHECCISGYTFVQQFNLEQMLG